ncbi:MULTISPECIES: hypothetical protein [unclassified Arcicella]|uniref:hypothetical protein n=1 Tax=unclassified Arcicella TaxID=2644986 RepID=UPI002863B592|nr:MULTISPECIES: hypothetical protein [unclassified Arcicella]MDR6564960.1 soluble lytic murein transglycosylase-like protein [Arcicella sp. BE51]MDR6814750.1 soluble lytic murein transglycosylase-like protein [Arcicella sp. BE140]MDR6826196.1 soluble lytic murein transglycosylase-like protein [Arcicella sp. BE139]
MLAIELLRTKYYSDADIAGNLAIVKNIRNKFGTLINEECSSGNGNLEPYLLESLYAIESKGDPNAVNGSTYGLGQLDTATASNIPFWLKKRAKIMTSSQEDKIKKLFGSALADCLLNLKYDNAPSKCSGNAPSINLVTRAMLLNPEKNIALSAMYMDYLIDKYSFGGTSVTPPTGVRLDKLIVHYNAGQGNAAKVPQGLTPTDTTNWVKQKLSITTSDYILKFIGKNGFVDILNR